MLGAKSRAPHRRRRLSGRCLPTRSSSWQGLDEGVGAQLVALGSLLSWIHPGGADRRARHIDVLPDGHADCASVHSAKGRITMTSRTLVIMAFVGVCACGGVAESNAVVPDDAGTFDASDGATEATEPNVSAGASGQGGAPPDCVFAHGCCEPAARTGSYELTILHATHDCPTEPPFDATLLVAAVPDVPSSQPYDTWTCTDEWSANGCALARSIRREWDCTASLGVRTWEARSTATTEDGRVVEGSVQYAYSGCYTDPPCEGTWEFRAVRNETH